MGETTRSITGTLIESHGEAESSWSGDYNFILFIKEHSTKENINVKYEGTGKIDVGAYYHSVYQAFLGYGQTGHTLQLTIKGNLEKDKMEYEGTGLIRIVESETR